MNAIKVIRIIIHVVAVLILLGAIIMVCIGVTTSGWETYHGPNPTDIYQEGLLLDCKYAELMHSKDRQEWECKFKFGDDVKHNKEAEMEDYQINTAIMLCAGVLLAALALLFSLCAPFLKLASIGWPIFTFFSCILTAVSLFVFYMGARKPERRSVNTNYALVARYLDDAFVWAAVGAGGLGLATILAIVSTVFIFLSSTRKKTIPKIMVKSYGHSTPNVEQRQMTVV